MPKSSRNHTKISEYLGTLEDTTLYTEKSRRKCFDGLKTIFDEDGASVTLLDIQRTLVVFVNCIREDVNCLPHALNAVLSLLQNVDIISRIHVQDLLPSALALLQLIKSLSTSTSEKLREISFQVLLSYPVNVLSTLITNNYSEVLAVLLEKRENSINSGFPINTISKESCAFLLKILQILPLKQRTKFVTEQISVWFSEFVPRIMNLFAKNDIEENLPALECLEALVEALSDVDYIRLPQWKIDMLENICDAKKFPLIIKGQLLKCSNEWHRLWIAFIKLLKNQITCIVSSHGTPINSMLPVVETAFKMDMPNRCKAFQCWDSLIDNFSNETNQNCMPKRIKLLLIPLKLNNARTEETALAKFNTWWNFIRKFQCRMDNYANEILIPFMNFAFGKDATNMKSPVCGAGQLYYSVCCKCLQAFAEIVGHFNCDCTTDLPKLNGKILNNKLLAVHWDDWMYSLNKAIQMTYTAYENGGVPLANNTVHVLCVWRSFVRTVADLPPNGVRRDMFDALIKVLIDEAMTSSIIQKGPDLLFSLILILFEDNANVTNALTSTKEEQPLQKVMTLVINSRMNTFYERYETEKMAEMLKPLTDLIVKSTMTDWLLDNLLPSASSLKIWTALAHSVEESEIDGCPKMLKKLLLWPLNATQQITVDQCAAMAWCTIYNLNTNKITNSGLEKEIFSFLERENKIMNYFKLCLTICLLKSKLVNHEDAEIITETLKNCMSQIADYKQYEQAFPMLVDTIEMLLNNVTISENETLTKSALNCVEILLTLTLSQINESEADNPIDANIFIMLNNTFKAVGLLFKVGLYSDTKCDFVDKLRDKALSFSKKSSLFKFVNTEMGFLLANCSVDKVRDKISDTIKMLKENQSNNKNSDVDTGSINIVKEFTSPDIKKIVKKSKKRETSIVDTVVENGEEYEVIKSNWKFNPRKLTENQKEKFQRKREDIPALYQDLSQSQDEFKLSTWKTDSQDTTTSSSSKSSKLITNGDTPNILKNIPNSDVVPNIMENILSDRNPTNITETVSERHTNQPSAVERLSQTTPKNAKSPRMALKDRVFRNVRNLIENSTPSNDKRDLTNSECKIENVSITTSKKPEHLSNFISSTPPLISADRPSRVKRKPKKFDDVELLEIRRARNSQSDIHCASPKKNRLIVTNNREEDTMDTSHLKGGEIQLNNNELCNVSKFLGFKNTDKVNDTIDKKVVIINQLIIRNSDDADLKKKESVQDLPSSEAITVTQTQSPKISLETPIPDELKSDVQNIEINVITDNNKNIENMEKVNGTSNNTVKSNVETENKNNESTCEIETLETPLPKTKDRCEKQTPKKSATRKSRIEKELAIDMVEGHPFLKIQSEKRTRKKVIKLETSERQSRPEKLNKAKIESKISPKRDKKSKENNSNVKAPAADIKEIQQRSSSEDSFTNEEVPCSEDVIESSQDSTLTTISAKSSKLQFKRQPIVNVERVGVFNSKSNETQDLLQESDCEMLSLEIKSVGQDTKDDIELPQNKTAEVDNNQSGLTENMDTEPISEDKMSDDVTIIDDDERPIIAGSEKSVGPDTQELAEADTQPNDPADFNKFEITESSQMLNNLQVPMIVTINITKTKDICETRENQEDATAVALESIQIQNESEMDTDMGSPFKDDAQRKQDFLNNTSEISPIKVQSPENDKTPPQESDETSSEYLLVKLSSPVQSNGEPFDKCDSPEFFTEDKVSPDKRDQSPPRAEISSSSGSPSSSLSLKKNRPQNLRPGGRAAHMLGLCVPDSMNTIRNSERNELEDQKKSNTSTPARRNLRVLYSAVCDNGDNPSDNEEHDNFLKFKKTLPSTDSSPSVPILKRKLIDIVDDASASPASKRKRVSFHDPPVSTTVSVQKYIEPSCIKSPSSAHKRLERQLRSLTKSPKRLETAFVKLDTILSKAVESFTEEQPDSLTNDTNASLDVTPAVEVVNTSELNDTDPVCPDLVDCEDPIENIASELSSPAMKGLLIKELEGKINTVGDLAKLTELEVNRLCIKAPKIQIVKKVLTDYVNKKNSNAEVLIASEAIMSVDDTALAEIREEMIEMEPKTACIEIQTDTSVLCDTAVQTRTEIVKLASTQTNTVNMSHTNTQTVESSKTASDVISSFLSLNSSEKEDFIENFGEHLEGTSAKKLSCILASKLDNSTFKLILNKILDQQSKIQSPDPKNSSNEVKWSFLKNILCERFEIRDLALFCAQLLQEAYNKPA